MIWQMWSQNQQNTPCLSWGISIEEFRFTVLPTPGHLYRWCFYRLSWCSPSLDRWCSFEKPSDGPTFQLVVWSNSFTVSRTNFSLYQTTMSIQDMVQLLLLLTKRPSILFSSKMMIINSAIGKLSASLFHYKASNQGFTPDWCLFWLLAFCITK